MGTRLIVCGVIPEMFFPQQFLIYLVTKYQSLKGAVVVVLCQNEAEVKCQNLPVHLTYRKGRGNETDFPCLF